ncbi:MAG: DUF4388 domain-containing protein, partial [Myxococcota bacterium]
PALLLGIDELRELPENHAVIVAGDLARIAFPELVSLIVHGRQSGVLRVYGSSATRTVVFSAGEVRGAYSDRVSERLGEIAVRMGMIKREDMEQLAVGDPRRAGRLAVERRLLSERDLWKAVQEHVTTVFQAILLETRGAFVLTDERYDDTLTVPGLSAEGLLMEGVRRLDELRVLRSGGDGEPARVLAAFNAAFRDIFATADDAGAGDALRRAAESVFEDDPDYAAFRSLRFTRGGELPVDEVLPLLASEGNIGARDPGERLSDLLSRAMLFLLFVAGAHVEPSVHQELHTRVKARVSRD